MGTRRSRSPGTPLCGTHLPGRIIINVSAITICIEPIIVLHIILYYDLIAVLNIQVQIVHEILKDFITITIF